MNEIQEVLCSYLPLVRIWLCGPFQLEWIDPTTKQAFPVSAQDVQGRDRAQALSLLKLLLCQPERQAHRDWIMEQFWPEHSRSVATHRLENVFSALRKLLISPSGSESLLHSTRGKKQSGVLYSLSAYPQIWVDTDAITWNVEQAARMERFGDDSLPLWQRAFDLLKRGPLLSDEPYATWVNDRRESLEGYARQCIHALARLYLARFGEAGQAEAILLLRTYWQQHKTDEDALRPLLELLGEQEHYQEAEEYYQQLLVALRDVGGGEHGEPREPDSRTSDIRAYLSTKQIRRTSMIQHLSIPTSVISPHPPVDVHPEFPYTFPEEGPVEVNLFNVGMTALILHQQQSHWDINELEHRVTQALDNMIPEIQQHQRVSRRSILSFIAGMPLALYGFATPARQSSPSLLPEEVIPLYAAGIPACWRLYYEGGQLQLEHVLPHYLSHLTLLTQNPSKLQKSAAGLLSQTYQLMALLTQGREHFEEAIEYCHQAAFYGQFAEDTNLQVMAFIRLQDTYWERRSFDKCFITLKQAELFAEKITPLLRGRIFARLANVYSHQSELASAQRYIDLAQQAFPRHPELDPSFLYSHTTHFVLYANEVSTHIKMGKPQRAWDAILKAEKFVPGPTNPRKIDVTQYQIQIATALGDLEQCSILFEKLISLVKQVGHELDMRNTYTVYQSLHEHWPREERIHTMKQLLSS